MQWHQLDRTQTICTSSTPTPHHSVFTGRMLFLTPNRVKALKTINKLEGKYALESTDPRESEIRAHLRP